MSDPTVSGSVEPTPASAAMPAAAAPKRGGRANRPRAPPHAKDAAKQAAFVANAGKEVSEPMPGTYPVIFDTGLAKASIERGFELNFAVIYDGIAATVASLIESQPYAAAISDFVDDAAARTQRTGKYRRESIATGILAVGQQIVEAHRTLTGGTGDTSALYGPELPISQLLRQLAGQLGEFNCAALGEKFLFPDFMSVVRRITRSAYLADEGRTREEVIQGYYFPCGQADTSLDPILRVGAQNLLRDHGEHSVAIPGFQAAFENATPTMYTVIANVAPFGAGDAAALAFYYGNRPIAAAGYNVNAYWRLIEAATGINGPIAGGADFCMTEWKGWASGIADAWSRRLSFNEKFLHLATSSAHRGRQGSVTQTFTRSTYEGITLMRGYVSAPSSELSLAGLYSCTWLWDEARGTPEHAVRDARFSTTVPSGSIRGKWIESGLKT